MNKFNESNQEKNPFEGTQTSRRQLLSLKETLNRLRKGQSFINN